MYVQVYDNIAMDVYTCKREKESGNKEIGEIPLSLQGRDSKWREGKDISLYKGGKERKREGGEERESNGGEGEREQWRGRRGDSNGWDNDSQSRHIDDMVLTVG